jgi:hypothetical protein
MAFPQGVNFRDSAGFVTDGTNEDWEKGSNSGSQTYPKTSAQGNTYGTEGASTFSAVDRNSGVDRRLAGINYTSTIGTTWRIDLPSAGNYNVRFAAGDYSFSNNTDWDIYDGTTKLAALTTGSTSGGQRWKDANNVEYTAATWPTSNQPKSFTFATTICRIKTANSSGNAVVSHFYIESASPSNPTATISWTEENDTPSITGIVTNLGQLSWTEANDTVSISATHDTPTTTGAVSWTEENDTPNVQAYVQAIAAISWTEDSDTLTSMAETVVERSGGGVGHAQKRRYRVGNRVVEVTPAELKKVIEQEILAQEQKAEKKLNPAQITKTVEKTLAPLVDLPLPDVLPVVKELKQRLLAVKEAQSLPVLKAVRKVEQQLIAKQEEDDEDEYILSLLLMD